MSRSEPTDDSLATPGKPKPSGSSSILQAFKNLTAGKPKASPSSPSTATTSDSPPPSGYSNFSQLQRYSATTNGKSVTEETDSTGEFEKVAASDNQYVGGPPQLQAQLKKLEQSNPSPVRVKAARKIAALLKDYPVVNVVGIWMSGRTLLHSNENAPTFTEELDAGYTLLRACVRYKTLTPQERRFFFDNIPRENTPATFSQRFKVLQEITTNGRYLDCLENVLIPSLVRLLHYCFDQVLNARKQKNVKQNHNLTEEHHLTQVYEFTSDVIKFNSKMFGEVDLRMLIEQLLDICRKTAAESDLRKSIEIMDAIMTYSYIPDTQDLYDYLQVLCVVFCAIKPLKDLARRATVNLLRSHHGPIALTALLMILKRSSNETTMYRDAIKGSVLIFHEMLSSDDSEGLPPIDIRKLISAVRKSLDIDSSRLEACALRLLLFFLQDNDPTSLLLNDKLWKNFSDVIIVSCKRLKPENRNRALEHIPDNILSVDFMFHTENEPSVDVSVISNQLVQCLANRLLPLAIDMDLEQKSLVMSLLMQVISVLDDDTANEVIEFYSSERLQLPLAPEWRESCESLYRDVLLDHSRSAIVRIHALQSLHDAYSIGEVLGASSAGELILSVLNCIKIERDLEIAGFLAKIAGDVAIWTSDQKTFETVIDSLTVALFSWSHEAHLPSSPLLAAKELPRAYFGPTPQDTHGTHISKALVRIFMRAIHTSATKTEKVFEALLSIAGSNEPAPDARVICLKVLFRMRGDVNHGIFIVPSTESEGIAAALCRTADTFLNSSAPQESPIIRAMNADDHVARRRNTTSSPLARTTSANNVKTLNSPVMAPGRINRPTPPLWLYPGPKGLPVDPYPWASHLVFAHLDSERSPDLTTNPRVTLKISAWLELLLNILQNDVEWEVFSYIIVHLAPQLMNHSLFMECVPQVRFLRSILCGQLANKSFHEPPSWTNLHRADVAICMYHVLTVLVSYHDHFTSGEQDDIVKMFVHGIGSWERASETCIHGLAVCCHELPVSVSRALESVLHKLSHIITHTHNAVHVLEFLSALGRLPELYSGFQEHEFKMVFEILFRYLKTVQTSVSRQSSLDQDHPRSTPPSSIKGNRIMHNNMEEHLPQYVFVLSYHVMTFWFMSLSLQDRPKQIPWIIENLTYLDARGRPAMDEQAQVTIDMMQRVAFSDRDETVPQEDFASAFDGKRTSQSWLIGLSILTIDTAGRTGMSQITRRRPSGTRYSIYRPLITKPPRHQAPIIVGQTSDAIYSSEFVGVLPADILQEFYAPQHISPTLPFAEQPIPLPDDEMTNRGLSIFDRISALDGHKVGILYVGEAQFTEQEILANVMGSADYTYFLRHIGTVMRLKEATFNTQGLDRVSDQDGQFTFCWRDRVSEIVFHIPTMMPTNLELDPLCTNKKKHVGNDYVNIIFNNAGAPYDFGTFSSAFNYVNIVITPEARASFVETRLWARDQVAKSQLEGSTSTLASHGFVPGNGPKIETLRDQEASSHITDVTENPYAKLNYKVTVITAPGMPAISFASETKIISGAALPAYVRLLALNASVFCQVWTNRESIGGTGEHVSSWRSRLKEILKLREKHAPIMPPPHQAHPTAMHDFAVPERSASAASARSTGANSSSHQDLTASARSTHEARRESGLFRRTSLANIWGSTGLTSPAMGPVNGQANGGPGDRTSWFSNPDADRASSTGSAI